MPTQSISFTSLPVDDQDRAIEFYTRHLGFEVQVDAPYDEDWRWIFLRLPGGDRIQFSKSSELKVHDKPALALVSDDVDADAERLADAGVEITGGPDDAPWQPGVRWMTIRDSEGNIVFIESMTVAHA